MRISLYALQQGAQSSWSFLVSLVTEIINSSLANRYRYFASPCSSIRCSLVTAIIGAATTAISTASSFAAAAAAAATTTTTAGSNSAAATACTVSGTATRSTRTASNVVGSIE